MTFWELCITCGDVFRIKEAAYSIYTDIQKNTQFLFSENLKKIKALDRDIDIEPLFVVLLGCDEKSK